MLHTFHNILLHGLRLIEWWILWQITHRIARTPYHFALCWFHKTSDNLHQRRLTCAVETNNTYLCTIEEREVNVLQNLFLVLWDNLRYTHH